MASEEEGQHDWAAEGSCSDGSSLPTMGMSSLSMASTGSSGCKPQKFRLAVEAVFSSEKSGYLWTVTGISDSPLVASQGDHFPPHLF